MKNNANTLFSFVLLIGDFFGVLLAFVASYIIRVKFDDRPLIDNIAPLTFVALFMVLIIFWLVIFGLLGLYREEIYNNRLREFGRLLVGSFVGILFLISIQYVINKPIFPARLVPVYGLISSFLVVLIIRSVVRIVRRYLYKLGYGRTNLLIVGTSEINKELAAKILNPASGYNIVGYVTSSTAKKYYIPVQTFATFSSAITSLESETIHAIIQTEIYSDTTKNSEIINYAQSNHIAFRFIPGNNELYTGKLSVDLFQDFPVVSVRQTNLVGWGRIVKRLFDIAIAVVGLIIAIPLMAVAVILMKIFDPGPILYSRGRLSRYNSVVKIYKIRSLKREYSGIDPEAGFAKLGQPELIEQFRANGDYLDDDPRISKIGRFIRKSSIDELPQLLNVLRGDLSIVGPRALVEYEMEKSDKKDIILSVKAGLTGLAVVSGRKDIPFEERRKLDSYYVRNWSLWLDITIMAKTALMLVRGTGAK
jgi:exopolysaccharide biosynthesis polyprenyl glycosylphosphotransferase